MAIPGELAPLDSRVGPLIPKIAGRSVHMPPESLGRLLGFARSLPQHIRTQPVPEPKSYEEYPACFGAVLMRMLANRNLNWWSSAETFARLTGGRLYLSAATVGAVGRDRKEVTPELLVGFATVLDIPIEDLAAIGNVELTGEEL